MNLLLPLCLRITSSIINVLASHCALLIVMVVTGVELSWTVILFPIPLILLVFFCFGFGLILATVAVKFRDIIHLYGVFTTGLMYLTPVIYALSLLPGWLYKIVRVNPITNYLMIYRDVMLNGMLPEPVDIMVALVEGVSMMALGLIIFAKKQDKFILNI